MPPSPLLTTLLRLATTTTARALATIGFVGIWTHVLATHVVLVNPASGPSMFPTFGVRDTSLVVSLLHRRGRAVRVGDCVVYRHPSSVSTASSTSTTSTTATENRNCAVCKRVVGLGGDYVVWGQPPSSQGLQTVAEQVDRSTRDSLDDVRMVQVPEGHAWVLGDNLSGSRDSRIYGPVPLALVMGKVVAKIEWAGPWNLVPTISRVQNTLVDPQDYQ